MIYYLCNTWNDKIDVKDTKNDKTCTSLWKKIVSEQWYKSESMKKQKKVQVQV